MLKKIRNNLNAVKVFFSDIPRQVWLLLAIVALLYSNTLINGFTFDDKIVVTNSPLIKGYFGIESIFSKKYYIASSEASYRPVVTLTYWLETRPFGIKPFILHLTNLFYHIIVVFLLFLWIEKNTDPWSAFFAAGIFGLHPALSEPVNSIGFREDVLAAMLLLITVVASLSNSVKPSGLKFVVILMSSLLSMLSKENAVMALPAIILTDYFFINRQNLSSQIPKYFFLGFVTLFFLILSFVILKNPDPPPNATYFGGDLLGAIISIPKIIFLYIFILILPIPLCPDWKIEPAKFPSDPLFWAGILMIVVIAHYTFKKRGAHTYAALWFVLFMLPAMNLIPIYHPFAERYLYVAMLAPAVALGFFLFEKKDSALLKQLIISIMILFSVRTFSRNSDWKSDKTLFESAVKYPCSEASWCALGNAYLESGKTIEAEKAYLKSLEIAPAYPVGYYSLGKFYYAQHKEDAAIECFRKNVELNPKSISGLAYLGNLLAKNNHNAEAISIFLKLVSLKSDEADIFFRLGLLYLRVGEIEKAKELIPVIEKLDKSCAQRLASYIYPGAERK